jgi:hypothetical protein
LTKCEGELKTREVPTTGIQRQTGYASRDHRPHPYASQIDGQQQQRDPRQHRGDRVQGAIRRLRAHHLIGGRERDRRVHLRNEVDGRQPAGTEPLLRRIDEGREVQIHRSALDNDCLAVAREHGDQLLVGDPDGLVPRRRELRAHDELADLVPDEIGRGRLERSVGAKVFNRWTSWGWVADLAPLAAHA